MIEFLIHGRSKIGHLFKCFGKIVRGIERKFFADLADGESAFAQKLLCVFDFQFSVVFEDGFSHCFFKFFKKVGLAVTDIVTDLVHI